MARRKFQHKQLVESRQSSPNKAIYPGMIIEFQYKAENVFDKQPMVLLLWNDYPNGKVHGINLNYLSNQNLIVLFNKLVEGAKIYGKRSGNPFSIEDQDDESGYDDNLPYRNLLKRPYTRMKLPTYRQTRGGNPLSKSQAKVQMDMLYEKVVKRFMGRGKDYQVYRSYKYKSMKELKVLHMNFERL
tara:strand:+ start:74 stop:631 length:558 start_codon:yes stop_codon:yes gene_type:complete